MLNLAAEDPLPSIQDLFRSYEKVNGGLYNIQAQNSFIISGKAIKADGQSYDFKLYRKRPNMMRMQVDSGKTRFMTVFDGVEAFRVISTQGVLNRVVDIGGVEAAQIKASSSFDSPFFKLRGRSESLKVVLEADVDGEAAFEIAIGEQANSPYERIWISKENYREIKLSRMIEKKDGDRILEEIYFSDFEQIRGMWMAKNILYEQEGELTQQVVIERIRSNTGIFDSFFMKPKS